MKNPLRDVRGYYYTLSAVARYGTLLEESPGMSRGFGTKQHMEIAMTDMVVRLPPARQSDIFTAAYLGLRNTIVRGIERRKKLNIEAAAIVARGAIELELDRPGSVAKISRWMIHVGTAGYCPGAQVYGRYSRMPDYLTSRAKELGFMDSEHPSLGAISFTRLTLAWRREILKYRGLANA